MILKVMVKITIVYPGKISTTFLLNIFLWDPYYSS